ncbi:hypothetical protein L7Q78_29240, partial [Achromobacter xylosoxidans]|nr:hypothetical protein [Achromobacter xylosoxidans]
METNDCREKNCDFSPHCANFPHLPRSKDDFVVTKRAKRTSRRTADFDAVGPVRRQAGILFVANSGRER